MLGTALQNPNILALFQALATGGTPPTAPLLAAPIAAQPKSSYVPPTLQPDPGKAGTAATSAPQDDSIWGSLGRLGQTFSEPGMASNYPFPRSPDQTGLQNLMAGFADNTLNLPQNIWQLYSQKVGQPFSHAVEGAAGKAWNWATQPENAVASGDAQAPTDTFTPGLPVVNKITGVESGGDPTASNPASSAVGLGQFTKATWDAFMHEKYPEVVKNKDEKFVLGLRTDPRMSQEATAWYAQKGVDALDEINMPATDTNIYLHHFLGGTGVKKLLTADPNAKASSVLDKEQVKANPTILGNNMTVQDVIDWAATKMGEAPGLKPIPRPKQVAPDFTAANDWYNQMAPNGVDQEALKNNQLDLLLAGIGKGLGSVNAGREGGGALFGALGAGSSSGAAAGSDLALQMQQSFEQARQKYAAARGDLASSEATTKASVANTNAQSDWMNSQDQADYATKTAALQAAKLKPKVIESNSSGIWVQSGDKVNFIPSASPYDEIEKMSKAFGADSSQVRTAKYTQLAQTGNPLQMEMEVIKDLVNDGLGPAVFGDGYSEALDVAQKQLPPTATADPKLANSELMKLLPGLLLGASQQANNYDWVAQAAALGNPGAALLVRGGSFKPQK